MIFRILSYFSKTNHFYLVTDSTLELDQSKKQMIENTVLNDENDDIEESEFSEIGNSIKDNQNSGNKDNSNYDLKVSDVVDQLPLAESRLSEADSLEDSNDLVRKSRAESIEVKYNDNKEIQSISQSENYQEPEQENNAHQIDDDENDYQDQEITFLDFVQPDDNDFEDKDFQLNLNSDSSNIYKNEDKSEKDSNEENKRPILGIHIFDEEKYPKKENPKRKESEEIKEDKAKNEEFKNFILKDVEHHPLQEDKIEPKEEEVKEYPKMEKIEKSYDNINTDEIVRQNLKPKTNREYERAKIHSVLEPVFATKIKGSVVQELPRQSTLSFLGSKLKHSIIGMNEDEADQLARVDETYSELSNGDVILWKPKTLIKKTWRIKNLGTRRWPKDTRLVSVTENLYFEGPKIKNFLKPGGIMDISVKILIAEDSEDKNIQEFILRMYCQELKWFGEPLIATCHIDSEQYFESMALNNDDADTNFPRVTENDIVKNFESARTISRKRNVSFSKILSDLNGSD